MTATTTPKEPPEAEAPPADARTLPQVLAERAGDKAPYPAVSWRAGDGSITTLTWAEYRELVLDTATGYLHLGVEAGQTVAILASNRVEHLVADLAASHCAAASVSLYPTLATEQLDHVVADAEPHVIVVEESAREKIERVPWVRENRPHLITLPPQQSHKAEPTPPAGPPTTWTQLLAAGAEHRTLLAEEIERRIGSIRPDDPLTYIYTSGTTGLSKGVILTHRNLLWDAEALERTGCFAYDYRVISSLPLAHVAERLWSIYMPLHLGGHVWCCPDAHDLLDSLRAHRPSFFMAVPRVWEKLRQGAEMFLSLPMPENKREALQADRDTLAREWLLLQDDAPVPAELRTAAQLAREGALRDIREAFGLDRTLVTGAGAAPLRRDVAEFFASLGIYVVQAYGLTETSGVALADRGGQGAGSVGLPLPGAEVRIAPDGEIELRCPGNTPGYRNLKDATAELYTADGWLRTGDVGRIDAAGRLHITDRKKEILVSSSGKNIAPTAIESLLAGRLFLDQVMVVGEGRPYLVALLTVEPQALKAYADTHGIPGTSTEALLDHPAIRAQVQTIVDQANALLSRPEQIKRFVLLPSLWGIESGELTPTLKMRRAAISKRYRDQIEALYQQA
ncbi:AMP-dependent synthetase/ligase [Streptomyces sp. 3214.6]|uniref:AMP-dependent synthetase/ligase n=1 Tax=Streptomyces sp. 3214.6 TaxID=1882757 RepID=UPI00090AFACE|nr:AMP-dependent synthetase/ligase [Streptomyces sp. 3214.6]SHH31333.1 long-chain acyl-CoA synthetase [Streptomyces sp. 3214.6]